VSSKHRHGSGPDDPARHRASSIQSIQPARSAPVEPADRWARIGVLIVVIILVCVVVFLADAVFGAIANQGGNSAGTGTPVASSSQLGDLMPHQLTDQPRP